MTWARVDRLALASALETVRIEQQALNVLALALRDSSLRETFVRAVSTIATLTGRLIVTGIGKSGIIGRKVAATMTSTGTPSIFLHPSEASHGDLGMITRDDIVLALTWSGETAELGDILAYCHRFDVTLIVVTSCLDSTAGRAADICMVLPDVREACPNDFAPTSSTTVQAVIGDALAIALIEDRGFSKSDFLTFHPRGRLAARLTTVGQLMGRGDEVPAVGLDANLVDATIEMSHKRYGATAVIDDDGNLVGAFTDGDLRRSFASGNLHDGIETHMAPDPLSVPRTMPSSEALQVMSDNAITVLFVCDGRRLVGALHLHDLLRAGVA